MKLTIFKPISRLLLGLGLLLTINAYGQPPAAPSPVAVAGQAATVFFIKFQVKPGKNAAFERAIGDVLVAVRDKEPGNVYCDLLHLSQDPQTYAIIERYKDAAATKAHAESEYLKRLRATLNDLLDHPPDVEELVFIRSK